MQGTSRANRRGASAVIVMMLFAVLMVISWFIINVSLIQRHHATAQIASDLASRYGVDSLSRMENVDFNNLDDLREEIEQRAQENWLLTKDSKESRRNRKDIGVDVEFGNSTVTNGKPVFRANTMPINSVRVAVDRDISLWKLNKRQNFSTSVSKDATSAALERDLCLVIDRSGSMNFDLATGNWMYEYGRHPYNALSKSKRYRSVSYTWWWYWPHPTRSRWSTMIPAVYGLVDELNETNQKELFSIASYSDSYSIDFYDHRPRSKRYTIKKASTEANPTFDYYKAVETFDEKYKYRQPVAGGTNISAGIDQGRAILTSSRSRPFAFKTMIVMTDGQYNTGRAPWIAAEDAAKKGIQVHTVTFSNQADQASMKRTAEAGNGIHFHAPDGDALEAIFREIAKMPAAAIIE